MNVIQDLGVTKQQRSVRGITSNTPVVICMHAAKI